MTTALVLLHPGVEEIEAVTPIDLLRRSEVKTTTASVVDSRQVTGKTGITLTADCHLAEISDQMFDLLVLPGGPGIQQLRNHTATHSLIVNHDQAGRWIAAICAAPLLLKDSGVLRDRPYTAHPSTREELPGAGKDEVVFGGNLITSQGAGTATAFSMAVIGRLLDDNTAAKVAESICWRTPA